jgi:hypothetical protein
MDDVVSFKHDVEGLEIIEIKCLCDRGSVEEITSGDERAIN